MSAAAVISRVGIIHVLDYTPREGDVGVPITVHIKFYPTQSDRIFLRLIVGCKAIATTVRQLPSTHDHYQLDAVVPFIAEHADKVPVSVQALDSQNSVIDSVCCGEFTFWGSQSRRLPGDDGPVLRRRANTTIPTSSPLPTRASPTLSDRRPTLGAQRRIRANSLMRTRLDLPASALVDLQAVTPLLQLTTPLDSMCANWDAAEHCMGRRLVRFQKLQDGRKLIISCEPVSQDDYVETETVISCIYRTESNSYWVTSVDIIYLLERLVNDEFPVEEKNRIRRNLEGLRPTTVSKHKSGFESFFQRIMEFPDPKPRNIEKDLKVFEWGLLGQALDKIIAKYSIYLHAGATSHGAFTSDSPSDSTQSSLSLPSDNMPLPLDVDSRFYHSPDADMGFKSEPISESLLLSQSHGSSECPTPAEFSAYDDYTSLAGLDFQSPVNLYNHDAMDYHPEFSTHPSYFAAV